ncbi:MAG: sulfur carrier protein ThiS [candidate division WOR-3 bacterium]
MAVKVLINGKEENVDEGISILELLKKKNIRPEVVTVELNGKIIERKDFQTTFIKESDVIEFVFFMGGGNFVYSLSSIVDSLSLIVDRR